jgi:hypothetical protein
VVAVTVDLKIDERVTASIREQNIAELLGAHTEVKGGLFTTVGNHGDATGVAQAAAWTFALTVAD